MANFENLNPANALWEKNYKLYANVDTERERFLEFERWWSGFYFLSREEFLFIVENLFIGNRLERDKLRLHHCCVADLKHISRPIVVFASSGDNITPPHQALNWVPATYRTTDELKRAGQRIVYLLNQHVGHLGIFVSADVARLEHRAILESLGELEALEPGLYEMVIENPSGDQNSHKPKFYVRFEERDVAEIRYPYPEKSFERVEDLSESNELIYRTFWSPWVKAFANPFSAEILKWMHPARSSRYLFSEQLSPWMYGVQTMARAIAPARMAAQPNNIFLQAEREASTTISSVLHFFQEHRDTASERLFNEMYGN